MLLSYRSLRKYKYQLVKDFEIDFFKELGIVLSCDDIEIKSSEKVLVELRKFGKLKVYKDYSWNNGLFVVSDLNNFMRAKLVKDVLYQMIKTKKLSKKKAYIVNNIVYELHIADGMPKTVAFLIYIYSRLFGNLEFSLIAKKEFDSIHVVPYL